MLKNLLLITLTSVGMTATAFAEDGEQDAAGADASGAPPAAPQAAQATPPPPPRTPPLRLDRQKADRVAKQLSQIDATPDQIQWFKEGSDDQYLGLFIEEYGTEPQGYALILHDNQQHPDWPGVVRELRKQLPAGGWSTLSIGLPDRWDIAEPPPREPEEVVVTPPQAGTAETMTAEDKGEDEGSADTDAQASEQPTMPDKETANTDDPAPANLMAEASAGLDAAMKDEDTMESAPEPEAAKGFTQLSVEHKPEKIPNLFQSRVQEALAYLHSLEPMPVIVIGVGASGTMMAKQAHDLKIKDIAGLVLIDPTPIEDETFDLDKDAAGLRIPVLDFTPQLNPRSDPKPRKRNAKREGRNNYEQYLVKGAATHFNGYETLITKKIRGWSKRAIINNARVRYL